MRRIFCYKNKDLSDIKQWLCLPNVTCKTVVKTRKARTSATLGKHIVEQTSFFGHAFHLLLVGNGSSIHGRFEQTLYVIQDGDNDELLAEISSFHPRLL